MADYPTRKIIWVNLIFFVMTTLIAVIGVPIYIYNYGVSRSEMLLFLFYLIATNMSITVGYHRLFAHATYKANPIVRFCLLFFGAAAFEQSALKWATQHRDHHRYIDTDQDPYSIKKGFFYAHVGWLIFWEHKVNYDNVRDLRKDLLLVHQHQHYHLWAITAGIFVPLFVGALSGHLLGALIFSVCARLTLVYHATFCINSVCHMFGRATYDIYATARDHWFVALITSGEGYHNFHHRFPSDYRNGVWWYQWDPSKWMIALLARLGLAGDLKRVSSFRILEAKLAADNQRINDYLDSRAAHSNLAWTRKSLISQYQKLKMSLTRWENSFKEYQMNNRGKIHNDLSDLPNTSVTKIRAAKREFKEAYQLWKNLSKHHALLLFEYST